MSVIRGPWLPPEDPLGPVRGILLGLLLGLVMWAVGLSVWAVLS